MGSLTNIGAFQTPDQIHWCTGKTPKRSKVIGNRKIVEKFPAMPYRMMIDQQGNPIACPLTDGAGTTKPTEEQVERKLRRLEAKGFFAQYMCPIATRSPGFARKDTRLTEVVRGDQPCATHVDHDGNPKAVQGVMCKHVKAEMKARRKANTEAGKAFAHTFKSDAVRMMEAMGAKKDEPVDDLLAAIDEQAGPPVKDPGRAR